MESEKLDTNSIDTKNSITLPKNYIGQDPTVLTHKRANSFTENIFDANEFDKDIESNSFRFKTERKKKKVSFNKRIQIINIHNYKYENKILYYGNEVENDDKKYIPKENKCLTCIVF